MAEQHTKVTIEALVRGMDSVDGLKKSVLALQSATTPAASEISKLREAAVTLGSSSTASARDVKTAINVLKDLQEQSTLTGAGTRQLAKDIGALEGRLDAAASAYGRLTAAQAQATSKALRDPNIDPMTGQPKVYGTHLIFGESYKIRASQAYAKPIGPEAFDYKGAEAGIDALNSANRRIIELASNNRIQRLQINEKYNALELEAEERKWRAELKLQDEAFKKELADFDAQLGLQVSRKERAAQRLKTAGQVTGAIASAAIFGGPEGALGAGIGAIKGGVPGALTGGAIGASVGILRQQLTEAADYASEIARLRIALKGVSTDQNEFNNSLKFIQTSSGQFLTSIGDATKNYTRLQASVRGAGMGVSETQKVFQGLSAAMIATGASTEDINGAMLAASQVFSKGKVSAEELRGQIGERLPGAFTIFAQSIGKTPQQLDKALQDGKVSLKDFTTFSEELFKRYGESAKAIGDSPFASSIRFKLAFDNMKLAAGQALQPIVVLFQDLGTKAFNAFSVVLQGQTAWQQSIDNTFDKMRKMIGGIAGIQQAIAGLIKAMIVLGGVQAGVFVVSNLNTFSQALRGIIAFTKELLTLEKAALAIESARAAFQAILAGITTGATKGKVLGAIFGGAAGIGLAVGLSKIVDEITKNVMNSVGGALNGLKIEDIGGKFGGKANALPPGTGEIDEKAAKQALKDATELNQLLQERIRIQIESGKIGADKLSQLNLEEKLLKDLTRAQIEAVSLKETNERNRQEAIINIEQTYTKERKRIAEERSDALKDIADIGVEAKILQEKFFKKTDKSESPLTRELNNINLQIDEAVKNADALLLRLNKTGGTDPATGKARAALGGFKAKLEDLTPGQKNAMASGNLLTDDIASLKQQIQELRSAGSELKTLDKLKQKYLGDWDKLDPTLRSQAEALANQVDHLRQMQQITDSIANSIGTGLTSAFDALIEGTQNWGNSLRQIAATVLKDIAKQLIKILVIDQAINAFKSIFNFGGGGGGAAAAGTTFAANGMIAANGIQPFAMGGVVTSPTLFKFANGGTMRNGLMGEAGPEAIIPLKRGADGKLGVAGGGGSGANVTVNVDAKGSSVQGDAGKGNQLARVVAAAVQQEMIKQKRPGGLLAA
jgi:hypothetical protein